MMRNGCGGASPRAPRADLCSSAQVQETWFPSALEASEPAPDQRPDRCGAKGSQLPREDDRSGPTGTYSPQPGAALGARSRRWTRRSKSAGESPGSSNPGPPWRPRTRSRAQGLWGASKKVPSPTERRPPHRVLWPPRRRRSPGVPRSRPPLGPSPRPGAPRPTQLRRRRPAPTASGFPLSASERPDEKPRVSAHAPKGGPDASADQPEPRPVRMNRYP
jgi:hypothetical protein